MSIAMSTQEMQDFLSESHIARIAVVKSNGAPHVSPVWYLWEDNEMLISVAQNSVKAKNIRQHNKVAITVDTDANFGKGVIIEGTAEIDERSDEIARKICQRYVRAEDVEKWLEFDRAYYTPSILLRIRPEKLITWDYSKDPNLLNTIHPKN